MEKTQDFLFFEDLLISSLIKSLDEVKEQQQISLTVQIFFDQKVSSSWSVKHLEAPIAPSESFDCISIFKVELEFFLESYSQSFES